MTLRYGSVTHAIGLLRRSGRLPAEPYPLQQRIQITLRAYSQQDSKEEQKLLAVWHRQEEPLARSLHIMLLA